MESSLNLWLTIIACGIVTFLIRFSFIAIHGRVTMPEWFTRALMFVPIAVLSAITLPEILIQDGGINFSPFNARLIAGIIAVIVAWRTKNILVTIVVGMLVLWGLQFVMR
ncbi:MAG: branched-chain amino acid ABC transporter permease [Chloroflexi bacterium UTCFX4]|jgi:branched-subunit amino acid transport protein|nr:MAG: branched-chain amino acid ABC transporter permease [Chloroflexi bacterium UTCFX4]